MSGPLRLPGHSGELASRSAFLSGKHKTLFGPGQAPGMFRGDSVHYEHPTDWRTTGSLLKRPIVVWISTHLDRSNEGEYLNVYMPYYKIIGTHGVTGEPLYAIVNNNFNDLPNWSHSEVGRIASVGGTVKSILESRYPGLVFVNVFDWMEDDIFGFWYHRFNKGYTWTFIGHSAPHTGMFGLTGANGSRWLPTRFLSIFVGHAIHNQWFYPFNSHLTEEEIKANPTIVNAINQRGDQDFRLDGTTWLFHADNDAVPSFITTLPRNLAPVAGDPAWPSTERHFRAVSEMESAQERGIIHKGSSSQVQADSLVEQVEQHFGLSVNS